MSHIQWDEKYSVNIEVIDEQHKKLIATIATLSDAMQKGDSKKLIGEVVRELTDYAGYHFGAEEIFLKQYGFPDYENHKKEHEVFRTKALSFQKDFEKGKQALSLDVINFLWSWLDHHIMNIDKKYAPFLNEKGIY